MEHSSLTLQVVEKGEISSISAALALKENEWNWVCVSHTRKGLWRSTVSITVNEQTLLDDKFVYPETLDAPGANFSIQFAQKPPSGSSE